MTYFLTSDIFIPNTNVINPDNDFVRALLSALPDGLINCVFIASAPADLHNTYDYANRVRSALEEIGLTFSHFRVLHKRTAHLTKKFIEQANLVILAGGHVPTQNGFFKQIHLKECLQGFKGVLIGISAGSMNCAEIVYALPESTEEVTAKEYQRFRRGLGITQYNVLPHYNSVKNNVLGGVRLFQDIVYPDSIGRKFYAISDGSFLYGDRGVEKFYGEVCLIQNGNVQQII